MTSLINRSSEATVRVTHDQLMERILTFPDSVRMGFLEIIERVGRQQFYYLATGEEVHRNADLLETRNFYVLTSTERGMPIDSLRDGAAYRLYTKILIPSSTVIDTEEPPADLITTNDQNCTVEWGWILNHEQLNRRLQRLPERVQRVFQQRIDEARRHEQYYLARGFDADTSETTYYILSQPDGRRGADTDSPLYTRIAMGTSRDTGQGCCGFLAALFQRIQDLFWQIIQFLSTPCGST